jgi:endonuclease/exonuclease/phosphatase family metal-dependent hydrolase
MAGEGEMAVAAEAEEIAGTPLRVATWNLNHWQQPLLPFDTRRGAWVHLADGLGAQVALVQEAVPPTELPRARAVYGEIAGHRNWGSAVVALDPAVEIEPIRSARMPWSSRRYLLDRSNPGSCAVARVTVPGFQPITVVSLYGVHDGSAVSSIHRAVADLLPLFESPDGARVILGGDLNVTTASKDARWLPRSEAALRAVESLGLVPVKSVVPEFPASAADCACGEGEGSTAVAASSDADGGTTRPGCGHIATWKTAELDHLYVSPALAPQAVRLAVDRRAVEAGLSDHCPLVLDLELSAEPTPHGWDEEAFAVEVGRRHGPAARAAVEALVSWAERKERELASKAGVTAKVLTRFPVSGGITAEPELLFTLDLQAEPRTSEVLLSIHASGDVVVWFGAWKLPPFDEPGCRHELRRLLNEIDGVDLGAREVYRWPRIPLALLEASGALERLAQVLDRLAEET